MKGIVQGVGFRPFVYRLANQLTLSGIVRNTPNGVEIEIEGEEEPINEFLFQLKNSPPPMALITEISSHSIEIQNSSQFVIIASPTAQLHNTLISPDIGICQDCQDELFDKTNRRFHYPFINCTNCGPRFSIIQDLPYDREFTTMKEFHQCEKCSSEYKNPLNRRFHAQPNACANCGPEIWLEDLSASENTFKDKTAINKGVELLVNGGIIGVKGLGGYHLAVDASNEIAVQMLRRKKNREEKPLAIMVLNKQMVHQIADVSEEELNILSGYQRPIVLLKYKKNSRLAISVLSGSHRVGIMLPYTPLHYLLMDRFHWMKKELGESGGIIVLTSGNLSEEPIAISNSEARTRLLPITNHLLNHNRDILTRVDDSVAIYLKDEVRLIRRSRGYVPKPTIINSDGPVVLAVGGELKNTICLLKNNHAFVSQHIGDLTNLETYQYFQSMISHFLKLLKVTPELIVHDMHPQYLSTQWALQQSNIPIIAVQHHHSHLVACLAEWKINEPVIGLILDGTGYGIDKTIWGGEVLLADYHSFKRIGHLEPFPLFGGDSSVKAPWKIAVSYLFKIYGDIIPYLPTISHDKIEMVSQLVKKKVNTYESSSCGRLFDAVSVLSGGRQEIKFEAQGAIELMQAVEDLNVFPFDYAINEQSGNWVMLIEPIIRSVVQEVIRGKSFSEISNRFHKTMILMFKTMIQKATAHYQIKKVVLSGGVFQNEVLFIGLLNELENLGLEIFTHKEIPMNDGGISLGQAVIGRAWIVK